MHEAPGVYRRTWSKSIGFFIVGCMIIAAGAGVATAEPSHDNSLTTKAEMLLWPAGAPEAIGKRDQDRPSLTPWIAPPSIATGAAIVVCPGGGYSMLAPHEGNDYARWLNEQGISAFVLKYRLGSSGYRHPAMLNDASRAIRIVRANAENWNIETSRIGIIGSSAGGHLASTALTHFDAGDAASTDVIEQQSSRPDLGILVYPVISMGEITHKGSRKMLLGENPSSELVGLLSNEEQVTSSTPPTFIFHTADDSVVPVQNALAFGKSLADARVPFELHVYPHGKHGMGLGTREWDPENRHPWTKACEEWLVKQGFGRK